MIHQRLAKMPQIIDCKIICINDLSEPFQPEGGGNDYQIFNKIDRRYGVYIFVDESDEVLYVGKAYKQSLKVRITQNYTHDNTGGTFRKNWCGKKRSFEDFKQALGNWKLVTVSTSERNDDWIEPFESELIELFRPQCNKRGISVRNRLHHCKKAIFHLRRCLLGRG